MITINGRKYAKNDSEFTDTLFDKDGTAQGFYKKYKRRILFMDHQKKPLFTLVHNWHNEKMILSASQLDDGKIWYQHLSTKLEQFLGLDKMSYSERSNYVDSMVSKHLNL